LQPSGIPSSLPTPIETSCTIDVDVQCTDFADDGTGEIVGDCKDDLPSHNEFAGIPVTLKFTYTVTSGEKGDILK
jgi:hypothetical protein